ncbi:pyrroline-5-carboxylate reductase [Vagococcus xieshaowenii]|uniref:Pyrroline-5-carboxylate reductase n=1 Tax=Vagococcus xieshaowenii TaxID=2562451 RepID=A0AAJ5EH09_9ENTE|nr:pyrroline-5-carboxylate reductase [Vagococcus xieshaowenii]QCA28436.1 pyrroline-5-carboxylate reductase [Vagococcus xieshaowenii]TFZ42808.1 pyrroline-5-carboxylate reductase [Vagococcus xieshaowenii]
MSKIGFLGAGNMNSGIIKGLLSSGLATNEDVYVTASSFERSKIKADELAVQYAESNEDLIKQTDTIILGAKPQVLASLLPELDAFLWTDKLIISIAAGISIKQLQAYTQPQAKIIRVMPNMNISLQKSVSGIAFSDNVTHDERERVVRLFNSIGTTYTIEEKDFVTFTAIAGCSPAFTSLYVDGLSRSAVAQGLPLQMSREIVIDAMIGTLLNLKENELAPWDLINQVCSPGGTTIQGVASLEKDQLTTALFNAVNATISRDHELNN